MTKRELIKALERFHDETEVFVEVAALYYELECVDSFKDNGVSFVLLTPGSLEF